MFAIGIVALFAFLVLSLRVEIDGEGFHWKPCFFLSTREWNEREARRERASREAQANINTIVTR